jgi:hypothetical protein
MDEVIEINKF